MAEETSTTETPAEESEVETTSEKPTAQDDVLGDAGLKALKAERDARKAAEKELAALRDQRPDETEKVDVEALKQEIRAEFAAQLTEAAIKAEAKGRMTDPADALLYIKASEVDGEEAIKAAVDKLLADKPYLAAQSGPKPWGDVGQGQRSDDKPEPRSAVERMARAYGTTSR